MLSHISANLLEPCTICGNLLIKLKLLYEIRIMHFQKIWFLQKYLLSMINFPTSYDKRKCIIHSVRHFYQQPKLTRNYDKLSYKNIGSGWGAYMLDKKIKIAANVTPSWFAKKVQVPLTTETITLVQRKMLQQNTLQAQTKS